MRSRFHHIRSLLLAAMALPLLAAFGPASLGDCARLGHALSGRALSEAPPKGLQGLHGPTFILRATTGQIILPDGNSLLLWGFAGKGKSAQYPGPTLIVNEGDTVTIHLINALPEEVSIVFPGQTGVLVDGTPAQPQLDEKGCLFSLTNTVPVGGESTFTFVARQPGTYLYESGTNPAKQVQMGLFGALVVRPALGAEYAYNDARTRFDPRREYLLLLHELDPAIHAAVEQGREPDLSTFSPRYGTINGRCFPDTIAPAGAPRLPAQPYNATVVTEPYEAEANPLPALVRLANAGACHYPLHTAGFYVRLIGENGRPLIAPATETHPLIPERMPGDDLSLAEWAIVVGAGQTRDGLLVWTDVNGWMPGINPSPREEGHPTPGYGGELPTDTLPPNECGEFVFPWYAHWQGSRTDAENAQGGMTTLLRVNPLGGCPQVTGG